MYPFKYTILVGLLRHAHAVFDLFAPGNAPPYSLHISLQRAQRKGAP